MGSAYTIFGKQVSSHWIAIATLSAALGLGVVSSSGSKAEASPKATPVPAAPVAEKSEDFDVEKLLK
ncbi:hypothetical protein BN1211_2768 [Cyberlindnera jadinii]|uniref:Uncharacterized protein n=1 Tax=Cyberlindnera jadinii (strain ATCC 18201 / CBS 1600 / BCRC 20928 / JCM 3617 / NBRC 0987 / NRRL Y-1542) TaxID=983966 RepID=A0A0H5C324_CYBJN|nr:hypothetical protein BN1211_2768 [Cyberlindnera jadinii]